MTKLTNESVRNFVENNPKMVRRSESVRYPGLFVLKYQKKVFYDNLWEEFTRDMRGTVVDADYNPIVMPFRKVFNHYENGMTFDRDQQVTLVRKVNGFMAAATYCKKRNEVLVSTTGSLDSPYVDMARDYLTPEILDRMDANFMSTEGQDFTFLFEIVHPKDPHVVVETPGAYLLSIRDVAWDGFEFRPDKQVALDAIADRLGVLRPEWMDNIRFSDAVELSKNVKHEGFMAHTVHPITNERKTLKLKSDYYKWTKSLGRMSDSRLKDILHVKQHQGAYPAQLLELISQKKEDFFALNEQGKFKTIRNFLDYLYDSGAIKQL